jgi:hypothetical protein
MKEKVFSINDERQNVDTGGESYHDVEVYENDGLITDRERK